MPNDTTWTYTLTPRGSVEHECSVKLQGDSLLWEAKPTDPDDGRPDPSCGQKVADFRKFGPPEVPVYLEMPSRILDALCESLGLADPDWRKPLPPALAEWFAIVFRGSLDHLAKALAEGVDINALDCQHRSALWHAAYADNLLVTRWLLEHGADPELRDRYGRTLLMSAATQRKESLVELLLEFGADKTARDEHGQPAWVQGVSAKAGGMLINSLRTPDPQDWNHALHAAAWVSNAAWLEGETWWADLHHPDVNTKEGRFYRTPLQECLLGFDPSPIAVRWLVEHGADLTVVDERDGSTILHHAARSNFSWLVDPCMRAGVPIDARDANGDTALSVALDKNERPFLVRALLNAGADPKARVSERGSQAHPPSETIWEKGYRNELVWSLAMFDRTCAEMRNWSGLCAYARLGPQPGGKLNPDSNAAWVEVPAEWTTSRGFSVNKITFIAESLLERPVDSVVWLTQEEALTQPWSWPGRQLLAISTGPCIRSIKRFRDERPRAMMSDPAAWTEGGLAALQREWHWQAPDWNARWEKCSLVLQHGVFEWRGNNTRVEQPIGRFRIEGPPPGAGFHRSLPRDTLDEICALIAETRRIWEVPCSEAERKERVEQWTRAQQPVPPSKPPEPIPHQSGLWCYAELAIEDVLTTSSGAPSAPQSWTAWMEFPAEWCATRRNLCEAWLMKALGAAYIAMNRRSADGTYRFRRYRVSFLSLEGSRRQPWIGGGKVLYTADERLTPRDVPDEEKTRALETMGDPDAPPHPVPISPPPYRGPSA